MIGKTIRLWIPALNRTGQVTYTVVEYVGGGSYKIECDATGTRTFATATAMVPVDPFAGIPYPADEPF